MSNRKLQISIVLGAVLFLAGCSRPGESSLPPPKFTTFQAASVVIGQADFTSAVDGAASPSAFSLGQAWGRPTVVGGRLYLPDYDNSRILGFEVVPTTNGASADFVLGQPSFTSNTGDVGADRLDGPGTAASSGEKLLAVEYDNNRVLVWNTAPSAEAIAANADARRADVVVGWDSFNAPATGCGANRLLRPESIFVHEGKLLVADGGNHRVLVFDSIPTGNGASADLVLGQQTMDTCVRNDANGDGTEDNVPSASTFVSPTDVWTDGTRLVVADLQNNRILIWNSFPTTNGAPADLVLGQSTFDKRAANDDDQNGTADGRPSARTFNVPYFVESDGTQLFVVDSLNNRVLVWTAFPTASFVPADVVLGQSSFTTGAANDDNQDGTADGTPSARTFQGTYGVALIDRQLFVADGFNHRYLIFNGE